MSSNTVPPFIITQLVANPFIGPEGTPESTLDVVNQRLESSLVKINSDLNLEIEYRRRVASSREINIAISQSAIAFIGCHGYVGALGIEYTPESSDDYDYLEKLGTTFQYSVRDKDNKRDAGEVKLQVLVINACHSETVSNLFDMVPHVVVIKRLENAHHVFKFLFMLYIYIYISTL
jgi:hypothetical protein